MSLELILMKPLALLLSLVGALLISTPGIAYPEVSNCVDDGLQSFCSTSETTDPNSFGYVTRYPSTGLAMSFRGDRTSDSFTFRISQGTDSWFGSFENGQLIGSRGNENLLRVYQVEIEAFLSRIQ